jgi:hypothetical protein
VFVLRLLTDVGGPFYDTAKPFRNWSALPFYQLDLPQPPFVDQAQLAWGVARAKVYLGRVQAQGYTGIVVDNLAHLITFDEAPERLYRPDEAVRGRALIYRAAFTELFEYAAACGMEVFVTTDMQWTTDAIRRYAGRIEAGNPRLAAVNTWALEELFRCFPQVAGVFVRVGEAGGAHNQGSEYAGHMIYRSAPQLRALIDTLLPVCERAGRLLVIRTWSIGIGQLGDLMWSRERYRVVFGDAVSPNLLVSVKHGPSDFFRHLPPNPTIGMPGPAQIVEVQNRREYELFGMVPSSIVELHRRAFRPMHGASQPAGVWAWNASGGWGGGTAALDEEGWSLWTELSSALTAALACEPGLDAERFVCAWFHARFAAGGALPQIQARQRFAQAAAALYLDSAELIENGWYLGRPARASTLLGRFYVPTLLWVWWLRPTAAPLFWAYLATVSTDVAATIDAAARAVARANKHLDRLVACCPAGDPRAMFVVESARYLRDCLAVSHALRSVLLNTAAAARAGDRRAWQRIVAQAGAARAVCAAHRAAWGARRDFPALELAEVERYLEQLERRPATHWTHARAAALIASQLLRESDGGVALRSLGAGLLALALFGAWRSRQRRRVLAAALAALVLGARLRQPALRRAAPWLCRRYFVVPSIFFETGPSFTEWIG